MNLKVIQWLIANRALLLDIVAAAKAFDRSKPYIDQWDVVDKIARLVIPVLQSTDMKALEISALVEDWDIQRGPLVAAMSAGADVQAMGIDWKNLIDVILPIVIAILQALAAKP